MKAIVIAALLLTLVGLGCSTAGTGGVGYREVQRSYTRPTDSGSRNMGETRTTYIRNYGL